MRVSKTRIHRGKIVFSVSHTYKTRGDAPTSSIEDKRFSSSVSLCSSHMIRTTPMISTRAILSPSTCMRACTGSPRLLISSITPFTCSYARLALHDDRVTFDSQPRHFIHHGEHFFDSRFDNAYMIKFFFTNIQYSMHIESRFPL